MRLVTPVLGSFIYESDLRHSKSNNEIRDLLINQGTLLETTLERARTSRCRKPPSTLSSQRDSDRFSGVSNCDTIISATSFEFDDEVVNSRIYRRVMANLSRRNGAGDSPSQPVTGIEPFMNRRKPKEQEQTDAQASDSQIGQSLSKRSKKGKKNAPEPKFELDLSTALTDTSSFRTSLMMTNLSARFSMLRGAG